MEGIIPEDIVEEIRIKNDIVSVVSQYVDIKKRGKNYLGLCPFHQEKTPSFSVSPEKQLFYCFGCNEGGNVISFIMKMNNLPFPEACEHLARQAGVEIPRQRMHKSGHSTERENIKKLNNLTASFYHKILRKSNRAIPARKYLHERGLTEESVEKFSLGFALNEWNLLLDFLIKKGFKEEFIYKAGLAGKSSGKGKTFDKFRNRIIFPIKDQRGDVIGFGGRAITDEQQPKYLNSPETPVFNKRKVLYGIDQAYKNIRDFKGAVVVEGYMDVIMMHQFGLMNALAPLGTSFTEDQGRLLKYNADTVYIAFDADAAGEAAALRSLTLLQQLGLNVKVCNLPDGMDPDDYLNKFGKEKFEQNILGKAEPFTYYRLRQAAKSRDIQSIEGKKEFVEEVLPLIAKLNSAIEQDEYLKIISDWLGTEKNALERELNRIMNEIEKNYKKESQAKDYRSRKRNNQELYRRDKGQLRAEEELLTLMLNYFDTIPLVKEYLHPEDFYKKEWSVIVHRLFLLESQGETELDMSLMLMQKEGEEKENVSDVDMENLEKEITRLALREHQKPDENLIKKIVKDCAFKIKGRGMKQKREELQERLKKIDPSQDHEEYRKTLAELQRYIKLEKSKNLDLEGRGVGENGKE